MVSVRSALVGDKMNVGEVEGHLERASRGWHVKSIGETPVDGRVGPGGLIILFERRVSQA